MWRGLLHCFIVDVAVAVAFIALYARIDEIAFGILYHGNKRFDEEYNTERLLSAFVVGLVPFVGFACVCYYLWTLEDRVEARVWNLRKLIRRKGNITVLQKPLCLTEELALQIFKGQIILLKLKRQIIRLFREKIKGVRNDRDNQRHVVFREGRISIYSDSEIQEKKRRVGQNR